MTREGLIKMIRETIDEAIVESLKQHAAQKQKDSPKKSNPLSEEEIDSILFFGGDKPKYEKNYSPITIKESEDKGPRITIAEIEKFEEDFKNFIKDVNNASVTFDKQRNGYSLMLFKGPKGVEAKASGTINIGSKGSIKWSYSILNGLYVNTDNLEVSQDNKDIIEKLYNFYDSWEQDWREKLTGTSQENQEQTPVGTQPPPAENVPLA